jgi:hypothetical protein
VAVPVCWEVLRCSQPKAPSFSATTESSSREPPATRSPENRWSSDDLPDQREGGDAILGAPRLVATRRPPAQLKLAFDEEVTAENVERKYIHKIRHPPDVFHHFAFTGQVVVSQTPLHKGKVNNTTRRGFAKKTLLKTARKVGFK